MITERYHEIVTEALALAAETRIRANGYAEANEPGWPSWDRLADQLYQAVVTATAGLYSDQELDQIGLSADARAIGRC